MFCFITFLIIPLVSGFRPAVPFRGRSQMLPFHFQAQSRPLELLQLRVHSGFAVDGEEVSPPSFVNGTETPTNWYLENDFAHAHAAEKSVAATFDEYYRKVGSAISMNPTRISEVLVTRSLPKRKPVSFHSTTAVMALGLFLDQTINMFSPGWHSNGLPRLFDVNLYSASVLQSQVTALLFAIVGFSGIFRLPPNTPLLRRLLFEVSGLESVVLYMLQDSNLIAVDGSHYTFDLLSWNPGSVVFWITFSIAQVWALRMVSASVGSPEKGRESVPWNGNRFAYSISSALNLFMGTTIAIPACAFTMDHEAYSNLYVPYAEAFTGVNMANAVCTIASIGLSMLAATLLFEKKVTQTQCNFLILLFYWPAMDSLFAMMDYDTNQAGIAFAEYSLPAYQSVHVFDISAVCLALAFAHGFWLMYQDSQKTV